MTKTSARTAAALMLLALAGCGSDEPAPAATSSAPANRVVSGTLTLDAADSFDWHSTSDCAGTGGYDDILGGAQVAITDSAGATVALGKLDAGKLDAGPGALAPNACKFTFLVRDVPAGRGFYGVEVAHRGRVQYPEQQLFGLLALTIG